jgi:hypothetical protein
LPEEFQVDGIVHAPGLQDLGTYRAIVHDAQGKGKRDKGKGRENQGRMRCASPNSCHR